MKRNIVLLISTLPLLLFLPLTASATDLKEFYKSLDNRNIFDFVEMTSETFNQTVDKDAYFYCKHIETTNERNDCFLKVIEKYADIRDELIKLKKAQLSNRKYLNPRYICKTTSLVGFVSPVGTAQYQATKGFDNELNDFPYRTFEMIVLQQGNLVYAPHLQNKNNNTLIFDQCTDNGITVYCTQSMASGSYFVIKNNLFTAHLNTVFNDGNLYAFLMHGSCL